MNSYIKKILSVVLCAVFTIAFILTLHFIAPKITAAPEATGEITYGVAEEGSDSVYKTDKVTAELGKEVTAVRISDLNKLSKITKVNYVPDRFVSPDTLTPDVQIVDLTKPFNFAAKGTIIIVILNLDPERENFYEQSESLASFKVGEAWNFTLSLPKIFNASNVYNQSNLIVRNGEIEDYDFINFTTGYDIKTEKYIPKVARNTLNLKFYTRRQALNDQFITIHYQSSGTTFSGIKDAPVIGTESAVTTTYVISQNLLIAFAVLAAVVCVVLSVLSILKRTRDFLNAIIWILGIVLMLFPRFMLGQGTIAPLFWTALYRSAAFVTLGGALIALGGNIGKFPLKYITPAIMLAGGIAAFITPFVPFTAATVLFTIYTVIKAIGAVALLAFTGFATFNKSDKHAVLEMVTAVIIAVATFASVFIPAIFPVYYYAMFWLCVLAVFTTFVGVFSVFYDTEKANRYLTANLHLEVEQQVKDIKAVITERDNLLQFVSHDMKKPLQSSASLIDVLIEREQDREQTKALKIVKQNNSRVIENLSEIGTYARFNYIAEPSQITDLYDLCAFVYDFHKPDCDANGIILKNAVDKHYKVFVKKQGLENAVSNIILNAIEHANCTTVTLGAKVEKDRIILSITDDGKGIAEGLEILKAYVTEKAETNGLGLFICNNIIMSMSGELTYESKKGKTVFYISLLKA